MARTVPHFKQTQQVLHLVPSAFIGTGHGTAARSFALLPIAAMVALTFVAPIWASG
jgi:hypothetical protein